MTPPPDQSEGEKTAAERAERIALDWGPAGQKYELAAIIAATILAAEQRGAEQMRERCAEAADVLMDRLPGHTEPKAIAARRMVTYAIRALTIPAPEEPSNG